MLQPRDQCRMPDRRIRHPVEQVANHRRIDADIARLIGLTRPGAKEDVADIPCRSQRHFTGRRILQVDRDVAVRPSQICGTARQCHHSPALRLKVLTRVATG